MSWAKIPEGYTYTTVSELEAVPIPEPQKAMLRKALIESSRQVRVDGDVVEVSLEPEAVASANADCAPSATAPHPWTTEEGVLSGLLTAEEGVEQGDEVNRVGGLPDGIPNVGLDQDAARGGRVGHGHGISFDGDRAAVQPADGEAEPTDADPSESGVSPAETRPARTSAQGGVA